MEALNAISEFLDKNIRIVQYNAAVVATFGVFIILKKTHAFSVFKSVNEIPIYLIQKNSPLRGVTKSIISDRAIKVQHIPIFFRNMEKRKTYFGEAESVLGIGLAGIQPREGCCQYIQETLLNKNLKIIPLGVSKDNFLESMVYVKKGMWNRAICINEELVERGLAVARHDKELTQTKTFLQLSKRLLAAEVRADKNGAGIWKRPSLKERFCTWSKEMTSALPFRQKSS